MKRDSSPPRIARRLLEVTLPGDVCDDVLGIWMKSIAVGNRLPGVGLLACALPVLRALRIHPAPALRDGG